MNKYLLLFCFVGLVIGQLGRISVADGVAITLLDIAVFLFVSYSLGRAIKEKKKLKPRLLLPIGLFVSACIISLVVNIPHLTPGQFVVALMYLLRWVLYAGVYFSVVQLKDLEEKFLLVCMIASGAVQVIGGTVQYFYFPDLRVLYYLGWDDHLYRLIGVFIDPNYQGAMYVLLFILLIVILMRHIKDYRSKNVLALIVFLLLALAEVVLTYSRSALVMLASSLATLFILFGNKKLIFSLSACALLFVLFLSNTYIEGLNPFRTASVYARLSSMKEAVAISKDNPVLGVGFNAFRYAQHRYGFRESEKWSTSHADAGTDNSFLFILATTGIVGLLAYMYLLRNMLVLTKQKIKKSTIFPLVAFVSTIGLIADSFFVNSLFYTFFMFWIWVLVGFTENR